MPRPVIASFDPRTGPPAIHGARRVGIRPGTELIHPLAVTGARPLRFAVTGLPAGLAVDEEGIVRGTAPAEPGDHQVLVRATNAEGEAEQAIELCVGDALALTPPMGWNSWNVYGPDVSAEVVVRVAEAIVANGMRDLGYQYVNIDDHWHAEGRLPDGTPAANPATFPDGIEPVARRVHELGLKLGIYSDAAHLTCGRCFGGHGYEEIDARTYAAWGIDLLKYDYCFAPSARTAAEDRYGAMGRALQTSGRSIVLSVCEWGFRKPWEWAPRLGGSYWRTTPDIFDSFGWSPLGMRHIAWRNLKRADDAGPGRWNDPDMLLVGNRGRGRSTGRVHLPNQLPPPLRGRPVWSFRGLDDVQAQTHMTLWAMMAAPLLASHDLADTDPYDLALLTNPLVLAVDQDPLGAQGRRVRSPFGTWQLVKPLADGAVAVSFTNLTRARRSLSARLADHGLTGPVEVIDAWTMEPLGDVRTLEVTLPRHASAAFVSRPALS